MLRENWFGLSDPHNYKIKHLISNAAKQQGQRAINGKRQGKTTEDDNNKGGKEGNDEYLDDTYKCVKYEVKDNTYYSNVTTIMSMKKTCMKITTTNAVVLTTIRKWSNLDIPVSWFGYPQ